MECGYYEITFFLLKQKHSWQNKVAKTSVIFVLLGAFFFQRIPLRSGIVIPCTDSWSWPGYAGWRRRTPTTTTRPRHASLPESLSCFRRQKSHVKFKFVAVLKKDSTLVDWMKLSSWKIQWFLIIRLTSALLFCRWHQWLFLKPSHPL